MSEWTQQRDGSWSRDYGTWKGRVYRTDQGRWAASLGWDRAVRSAGIHDTFNQAVAQVDGMARAMGLLQKDEASYLPAAGVFGQERQ